MGIRITEDRVVSDSDKTLEICAKDISASEINPRIGGRKFVLVHADVLRLDSPIVAPGAAVTLIARKAYGGAQASINVTGVDGVDAVQSPPPTPLETSSAAPNGSNGGDAGATGSIDVLFKELEGPLTLVAVGGFVDGLNQVPTAQMASTAYPTMKSTWREARVATLVRRGGRGYQALQATEATSASTLTQEGT